MIVDDQDLLKNDQKLLMHDQDLLRLIKTFLIMTKAGGRKIMTF